MRRQIIKAVSWLMLFVFFLAVAPKEYIHNALYHHHDTVHPLYKKGEIVITPKHTHCEFLGFAFAPYIASPIHLVSFDLTAEYCTCYILPCYHFSCSTVQHVASLRGPPVSC